MLFRSKICRCRALEQCLIVVLICSVSFQAVLGAAASRAEYLVPNGKYVVSWETDTEATKQNQSIVFKVDVETLGYVGFGISPKGGMTGADIVIGGVFPNGTSYFRVCKFKFRQATIGSWFLLMQFQHQQAVRMSGT